MSSKDYRETWLARVREVRGRSLQLAAPLTPEDAGAQAMADASPSKWHLAHTTWFFEQFLLGPAGLLARAAPQHWAYLFNSYYEALGPRQPRPERGLMTRPTLAEVLAWRADADLRLEQFCNTASTAEFTGLMDVLDLGLHHEEQHQELMLTDILALFALQYAAPAYRDGPYASDAQRTALPLQWQPLAEGLFELGAKPPGFAFDNEGPRHPVWLPAAAIATRLITQGEWLEFITAGGYRDPRWWLAEGWAWVQQAGIHAPGYWQCDEALGWTQMGLWGRRPIEPAAPVVHVSYWEADAYARFVGARLPSEAEWECYARPQGINGNLFESGALRPQPALPGASQCYGDVWEWTQSPYTAYPGFKPAAGAVGEYNGKFMAQQYVLRGGSCLTPQAHIRASYRNFFYPQQRWQFTGLRLARDYS